MLCCYRCMEQDMGEKGALRIKVLVILRESYGHCSTVTSLVPALLQDLQSARIGSIDIGEATIEQTQSQGRHRQGVPNQYQARSTTPPPRPGTGNNLLPRCPQRLQARWPDIPCREYLPLKS